MGTRVVYTYDKETKKFTSKVNLPDTHHLPDHLDHTETPFSIKQMQDMDAEAFFRDGKWVFEPKPEVEPDQKIG